MRRLIFPLSSASICVAMLAWLFNSHMPSAGKSAHEKQKSTAVKRLIALRPDIESILSTTGTVGCSLGIIHHGSVIHTDHFGYRDLAGKLPTNDDTIYPIASLSKSMTAATVCILVDQGIVDFDTKVSDVLSDFNVEDDDLRHNATLTDLLSHRSGLQGSNWWLGSQNNVLFPAEEAMKVVSSLKMAHPFRSAWEYSNYGYEVVSHVMQKKTGKRWPKLISDLILQPLQLTRTGFDEDFGDHDNVALAYATRDDASPVLIEGPKLSSQTILGAGGGVRSSLKDMLEFYRSLLTSFSEQQRTGEQVTLGSRSPFRNVAQQFGPHSKLSGPSYSDTEYGFGLARVQLPDRMGAIGANPALQPDMPIVGKGSAPKLALYHQGTLAGSFATVVLFPETDSGIVVLTNSLPLGGSDDWISQLVTEALFDVKDKNDYSAIAKQTADSQRSWENRVVSQLPQAEGPKDAPRPLEQYVGHFYNKERTLLVKISQEADSLIMNFQNNAQESYTMTHCRGDVFTWFSSRNDLASRGRFTRFGAWFYLIKFAANSSGRIVSLNWQHDEARKDGTDFSKDWDGQHWSGT